MNSRNLADLNKNQVGTLITAHSIMLQPIGAIEQHGPHLPLVVDSLIAQQVAERLTEEYGEQYDLWLLPTIWVGKSNEHAWSPGTLWYSARTLLSIAEDIGRSVASTAARRLVFLNGHGGNSALLGVACREIRLATGLMTFLTHPFLPPDQGGASPATEMGMGIHGGRAETSMMLYLRPELVDMSQAKTMVPTWIADNQYVRFGGAVTFGWLSNDFGGEGSIGDPTGASAAEGEELIEKSVTMLGEQMNEIARFDIPV